VTADRRNSVRSPLGMRVVGGFVAVAVAAVFVLAGLTLWRTKHSVGQLAHERQQATADVIAQALALGYTQGGGWSATDPHPAMMLAVQAGAVVTVLDAAGTVVDLRSDMVNMPTLETGMHGSQRTASVVVDGHQVGSVVVTFTSGELVQAEMHVRDALRGTVLIGALVAALVALLVAVPLARRIVRPLRGVTDAARRLGEGDANARAGGHDAPGEIGSLARTFDVMADRLQADDVARRNLAADVAHELRTPLTLLQGGCEEVIDGIAEPSLEHFVQMHDDVLRLRRLVDDLAELAEADAARAEPTMRLEACDLAGIASSAVDTLQPLIAANQHHLVRHLEPAMVAGDPLRLSQIVTNLLTNAIKFTPAGGSIDIRVHEDRVRGVAVLTVSDTGPGIDDDDRAHVFERFYRGARALPIAGSGIGLAVVDQLVKAQGGSVNVADSASGATLVVTMPASGTSGRQRAEPRATVDPLSHT
jgi:two-component system sensor histidine kinase BaeS